MKRAIIIYMLLIMSFSIVVAVEPFGANVTEESTGRAPADAPQSHAAIAGNVTELNIVGTTITQTWQGYFGNVSGTVQLADSSDNVLYNWSVASPSGEVYASTNSSIDWSYAQCLNFTSNGTYASDTAQAGTTSLSGTNPISTRSTN